MGSHLGARGDNIEAVSSTAGEPKCRVAICDDVKDFRDLLSLVFEHADGFEVIGVAANGHEAVALAAAAHPDVLLLDVAMPVMDGIEALPLIRQASPSTRVVVLTGFGSDTVRARALDLGAVAFLEKGLLPAELVDAVRVVRGGPAAA